MLSVNRPSLRVRRGFGGVRIQVNGRGATAGRYVENKAEIKLDGANERVGGSGAVEQRNVGSWFEETRRTEKEECKSIEIDYLKVKISLELPSQRSKELHSRMQSETLEMKRRAQYTNSGGSVDPAESNDRRSEVEGKRGKREMRGRKRVSG